MKIAIEAHNDGPFPFKKMIHNMIVLVPPNDISGLEKIAIKAKCPIISKKTNTRHQACYYQDPHSGNGHIDIFLENIINVSIPDYAFNIYTEIGGLLLSEIIYHEIGHHVHYNKRHGIPKKHFENFADRYARAGYCAYYKSRESKILSSYWRASLNIVSFTRKERHMFRSARRELMDYFSNQNENILFP